MKTSRELRADADRLESLEQYADMYAFLLPLVSRKYYRQSWDEGYNLPYFKGYSCKICNKPVITANNIRYNPSEHQSDCILRKIETILEPVSNLCDAIVDPGPEKVILVKTALEIQKLLKEFGG
jgi:beta-mannanase